MHSLASRLHHRSALTVVAGLTTWLGVQSAAAAAPCMVTDPSDLVNVTGSLRYCVDQVNQGLTDHIVVQAFHWYAPNSPLVLERSATISGVGRIVMPGDEFVGESLFIVGTQCPGAGCQGQAQVEIEGLELAAVGVTGVRGIDVRAGHGLVLDGVQLYEFTKLNGNGGCIRAGQQSSLTIMGSTFEGCMAADGGAVFSEASSTEITDSAMSDNHATFNGGAIAIGTANFFPRSLSIGASSFAFNTAFLGGAIKATGPQIEVAVHDGEFLGNQASQRGGGLYGKGTFVGCRFEANTAGMWGGGLSLIESSVVQASTFWGNEAVVGGGVAFQPAGLATLTFEGSTAAYNTVKGDGARGAGMAVLGGEALIRNATFSANGAHDDVDVTHGGGLAVVDAKATVEHATFASNFASSGGGIHADGASFLDLGSSIVAYSSGSDCAILGAFSTQTSLDTDKSCGVDFSAVDPDLDVLGDNGGPTWTHWPHAGDVQGVAVCLATEDQRGMTRPADECDVGALDF